MSLVLQSVSSKADEFCWARRMQTSLLDLSAYVGDKGWFPAFTQCRRGTDLRIQVRWVGELLLASRAMPGMYCYLLFMMTHFFFPSRALNVFTDTQTQGSLSSKLGLFTVQMVQHYRTAFES